MLVLVDLKEDKDNRDQSDQKVMLVLVDLREDKDNKVKQVCKD